MALAPLPTEYTMSDSHVFHEEEALNRLGDRARKIRLVLTDVDGVLTSSHLLYGHEGLHLRAFSTKDGAAMNWLPEHGIPVGFISALDAPSTRQRARDLKVEEVHLGSGQKLSIFLEICHRRGLEPDSVAYLGDDLHDLPVLRRAGLSICPEDAVPEVLRACHWVVPRNGGEGVFRAAGELILKAQGHWQTILARYE
jgi:3-deoxy-D-manno-octulosonate 8-phosphate phosphatase (KDO 8-P phosphatase)